MKRFLFCSFLIILFLLPMLAQAGEAYIWTDKQGVTHIEDKPPSDTVKKYDAVGGTDEERNYKSVAYGDAKYEEELRKLRPQSFPAQEEPSYDYLEEGIARARGWRPPEEAVQPSGQSTPGAYSYEDLKRIMSLRATPTEIKPSEPLPITVSKIYSLAIVIAAIVLAAGIYFGLRSRKRDDTRTPPIPQKDDARTPTITLPRLDDSQEQYQGFKDPTNLTKWLQIFFILVIIISAVGLLSNIVEYNFMERINAGYGYDQATVDSNDTRQGVIGVIGLIIGLTTWILYLIWVYRANYNARRFAVGGMEFTPRWSVGWYFVPIANFWKPYQAMKEIWNASEYRENFSNMEGNPLLWWWWGLFILNGFLGFASLRSGIMANSINELFISNVTAIASDITRVIYTIVAMLLIGKIYEMQMHQFNPKLIGKDAGLVEDNTKSSIPAIDSVKRFIREELNTYYHEKCLPKRDVTQADIHPVGDKENVKEGDVPPLIRACFNHQPGIVRILLGKGEDVNTRSKIGETALMVASSYGYTDIIKLLLEKGAAVDAKKRNTGANALMYAAQNGHDEAVRLLLSKCWNVDEKRNDGHTALSLATKGGHTKVITQIQRLSLKRK